MITQEHEKPLPIAAPILLRMPNIILVINEIGDMGASSTRGPLGTPLIGLRCARGMSLSAPEVSLTQGWPRAPACVRKPPKDKIAGRKCVLGSALWKITCARAVALIVLWVRRRSILDLWLLVVMWRVRDRDLSVLFSCSATA